MNKPRISIIVAMDEKRGIGKQNAIPWHVPGELKRFKEITTPHPMIMGRKTFESIGKVLPGRPHFIITRDTNYNVEGATICHSLDEAINKAKELDQEEIFIIGGGEIFKLAMPYADRLYLTLIKGAYEADVFFPDYAKFKNIISHEAKETNGFSYEFLILERNM